MSRRVATWATPAPGAHLLEWRHLVSDGEKASVVVLKDKAKSQVYRLAGVGNGGSAVIAKRCQREAGLLEQTVYTRVLDRLPAPSLHCYGSIPDDDPGFVWLFVEEAQGEPFSSARPEHSALGARWLAAVHTSVADFGVELDLPDRGADYYLDVVRSARQTVDDATRNAALSPEMRVALAAIGERCAELQTAWRRAEEILASLPSALVHGDFAGKNVVVGARGGSPAVLTFDWDAAGFGSPAADISKVDVQAYHEAVRGHWPSVDFESLSEAAVLGRALWSLSAIPGQAPTLSSPWGERATGKITYYLEELTASAGQLGLGGCV